MITRKTPPRLPLWLFCLLLAASAGCIDDKRTVITILGENSGNLQSMRLYKDSSGLDPNVTLDFKSNSLEETLQKATDDFNSGTGYYDIVLEYNLAISSFVRNNYVYTIDELTDDFTRSDLALQEDFFDSAWHEIGWYYRPVKKTLSNIPVPVGYPFAANTMVLVYNQDMFKDEERKAAYRKIYRDSLAVPKTWKEFKRIAAFFTDPARKTYGLCMTGGDNGWLYYEYCAILYGNDGAVFKKNRGWEGDSTTLLMLDSPNSLKATEFYDSLFDYNCTTDYLKTGVAEQLEYMKQGNVAMAIMWSDYLYKFTFDAGGKNVDSRFGFAPLPGGKSPLAGGVFYVNRQSDHAKEAMQYIMSIMREPYQVMLTKKGLCSARKSVYEDTNVLKIPYARALKKSLENGVYMFEAGPESGLVQDVITKYIGLSWLRRGHVSEQLASACKEIREGRDSIYRSFPQ
jgi:multiple sugar transport system substrate-binding protein